MLCVYVCVKSADAYSSVLLPVKLQASSIPLCIVDVFKHFKKVIASLNNFNTRSRKCFAIRELYTAECTCSR
jgi:hypothetical protein